MFGRKRLAMLSAEFLGTGILTLVLLSVQRTQLGLAFFVAIAVGLAIVALTYTFSSVSGAHFNPALTIALWTARRVKTGPAIMYIAVQLLGAWAAYGLYKYFVNTDIQPIHQAFTGRIMAGEAIGAMIFALAWSAAAYNRFDTSRFAAVAGIGFIIAVITASAASVGLVNPALAIGAHAWDVFTRTGGWGNYVLGPVLGAVIGVNLYGLLFADPDAPFSFLNRRSTKAKAARVSSANSSTIDDDLDDDDDDVEAVDVDKAINKNAKLGTVAPRSEVKVTKSRKSTAKKVAAKKKRS